MGENLHWLLSRLVESLQDAKASRILGALAILFLVTLLWQLRRNSPIRWKPLVLGILVAPTTWALSLVLAPLADWGGRIGSFFSFGLVACLILVQLVGSFVALFRNRESRLILATGLLFGWWLAFMTAGIVLGLTTGLGRTWM
jgi:hypothetical protein